MALLAEKNVSGLEYKEMGLTGMEFWRFVFDVDFELAKLEMPGLMAYRAECGTAQQRFKGVGITESIKMAIQKWCTKRGLDWSPGGGPYLIVDYGGYVTFPIHEGVEAEEEFQMVLGMSKESIKVDPLMYHMMKARLVGVSEETTTAVERLYQMQASWTLPFPAINVHDPFTKIIKRDDLNGCRLSLPDGLFGVKYVMSADNVGEGCGYGDVGKPFRAVKPVMEALPEDVFGTADIFGDQYARKMKNNAIVCSIGHFDNFYIQGFEFKRQTDECVFPDTNSGIIAANLAEGRLMNLGCATDHPSFVLSCSFTKQVISQLELWNEKKPGKYEEKVYVLPKQLDEKVAALNLPKLGAKLTKLSPEQAAYINVPIEGPYEPAH